MWVSAFVRPLFLCLLVSSLSTTSEQSFSFLPVWFLFTVLRACIVLVAFIPVNAYTTSTCYVFVPLSITILLESNRTVSSRHRQFFAAPFPFAVRPDSRSRREPEWLWFVFVWVYQEDSLRVDPRIKGKISLFRVAYRYLLFAMCNSHSYTIPFMFFVRVSCFCVSLSDKKKSWLLLFGTCEHSFFII